MQFRFHKLNTASFVHRVWTTSDIKFLIQNRMSYNIQYIANQHLALNVQESWYRCLICENFMPDCLFQLCRSVFCPVALLFWKPWRYSMGAIVIDISGSQVVRVLVGKQARASLIQRMNHCWGRPEGSWYSDSYLPRSPTAPILPLDFKHGHSRWSKWCVALKTEWSAGGGLLMPRLVTPG